MSLARPLPKPRFVLPALAAVGCCLLPFQSMADPPDVQFATVALTTTDNQPPKTIAGRTLEETIERLKTDDRTAKLMAVRSLRPFGNDAAETLATLLSNKDPAVRYLAAEALGDLPDPSKMPGLSKLRQIVKSDASPAVQLAAAYAVCKSGDIESGLTVMLDRLDDDDRGMVCSAAMLIGKIGKPAGAAIEKLEQVYEYHKPGGKGDYHKGGAAKNALRKLGAIE